MGHGTVLDRHCKGQGGIAPCDFLQGDQVGGHIQPQPSVFGGNEHPQETQFGQLVEHVPVEGPVPVPGRSAGHDFALREVPGQFADFPLIRG